MKNAQFLRMVETIRGIGFLYRLSEPFHGSHHVFLTLDRWIYQCSRHGEITNTIPWLAIDDSDNQTALANLGYMC